MKILLKCLVKNAHFKNYRNGFIYVIFINHKEFPARKVVLIVRDTPFLLAKKKKRIKIKNNTEIFLYGKTETKIIH